MVHDCPCMPTCTCTVYYSSALSIFLPDIISCLQLYHWHCLQRPDFYQGCIIEGYVVLSKLDYINRWLIGYHAENTIARTSDHSPQRMHAQRWSTLTELKPVPLYAPATIPHKECMNEDGPHRQNLSQYHCTHQ